MTAKKNFLKLFSILAMLAILLSNIQPQPAAAQSGDDGGRRRVSTQGDGDGVRRQVNPASGKVNFIGPENGRALPANQALGMSSRPQDPGKALARPFGPEFGVKDPDRELAQVEKKQKPDGQLTVKYQQQYENIPVMGGELIVNTNGQGDLYSINGEISPELSLSTRPGITAEEARQAALNGMAEWYEKPAEGFATTEPALWIYDESLLKASTHPVELTWRMEVTAKDNSMPVRELVLVNAQDGSVSLHFNQVDTGWHAVKKVNDASASTPESSHPTKPPVATDVPESVTTPTPIQAEQSGAEITTIQSGTLTGNIRYVATTGNDSNDCATTSTPCATIQAAINKASNGDVIEVAAGTYTGTGSRVITIGTSLYLSGGWNSGFTAQTSASTIDGQNARQGVFTYGDSAVTVTLERFAIINGFVGSGSEGGGILNNGNILNLNNVTLSNNIAQYGYGGGINNRGTLNLNNVTLSNNDAGFGGGIFNYSHILTLNNTLVGGNTAHGNGSQSGPDCYGTINASYFSLIGDTTDCQVASGQGNLLNVNPRLAAFDSTGSYYPLMLGSPAIDAGNPATPGSGGNACLAADQRGVARPLGTRCDIGAYEGSVPWTPTAYVNTYTAQNYYLLPGAFLCNQTDPNCAYGDSDAKSAHTYAIGTYNFYLSKFSRDSIDNAGMTIKSTVHYCDENPNDPGSAICPYDNALWNGTQVVYGDAHGYALADDVVAHELTHGVTQYESDLFYYYQSGAINESFSDVFGEYYDQIGNVTAGDTAGVKWYVGEDVSGLGALRNMKDPTTYSDPDRMGSSLYYKGTDDNGGVHWNSGVNNKAVYLMVDGDTFNGKTVTGLGWDKVGAIYYEASTNLLTSAADYSDLYFALQQACTNLVGQKGITAGDCTQVKDALDAVEMNTRQALGNFADPGFELYTPNPYWEEYSYGFGTPLCTVAECGSDNGTAGARTGSVWSWFGGTTDDESAYVSQTVYFPDGYPSLKLKIYLWIGRANAGSSASDRFVVDVDGVPVFTANATQKNSYAAYTPVIVDVSGFDTNALHTVTFSSETSGQIVNFNLDDVSLSDDSRSISGNAGVAGAILQYTNNGPKTVTADASGNYSIAVPYNWSGVVMPYKAGYAFTPANRGHNNVQGNQVNQNYTAQVCAGCADTQVLIGPGTIPVASYTLQQSQSVLPRYGLANGPVRVKSTNGAPIFTSQRAAYGSSFNELMGFPANQLTTEYWFTYYDNIYMTTYLMIGNAHPTNSAHVEVYIGNGSTPYKTYDIAAGESILPTYAGIAGGPVRVKSTNGVPIFTSQRAAYGNSFNELMGFPANQLTTEYWFTYYDNIYMTTYLMIGNAHPTNPAHVEVYIGNSSTPYQTYDIAAGQSILPKYNGVAGGPVRVVSTNGVPIFTSQRAAYGNSFNELMGFPANQLTTEYWFTYYDNIYMTTYLMIGNAHPTNPAHVEVYIGNSSTPYVYDIPAGESILPTYAGVAGGAVRVKSTNGVPIFTSQRAAYGNSFNELMGFPANQLTTDYWFTYYDDIYMSTWLMIGRP